MNNNKKHNDLQFTELTPEDVAAHKNLYALLLIEDNTPLYKKGEKIQEAKRIFCKTFE